MVKKPYKNEIIGLTKEQHDNFSERVKKILEKNNIKDKLLEN